MDPSKPLNEEEKKTVRQRATHPDVERTHEGSFSYDHEDPEASRYERDARYGGRDEDGEGRYGIDSQIIRSQPIRTKRVKPE
jgi:hypothetical protein